MSRAAHAAGAISRNPRLVRFCGYRLRVSAFVLLALVAVLTLSSAQATGAKRRPTACTSGASSIRARVVDGELIVSPVATSGCIPRKPSQPPSQP